MRAILPLLLAAVALVGATGAVAAADASPPQPDGDTTTNESETTTTADSGPAISPGQQLAGAVGAQGASLQGELWNRTLSERLSNATTADERAAVVADEADTLEAYLDDLTAVRENLTEAWETGDLSEGRYRTSLSEFVVRARTVELRANQTARAAEDLPPTALEPHDLNASYIRDLGERAHALYQFEDEVGRAVANETLDNQSRPLLLGASNVTGEPVVGTSNQTDSSVVTAKAA